VCAAGPFSGELAAEGDAVAVSGVRGLVVCVRELDGGLMWRRGIDADVLSIAVDPATSTLILGGRQDGSLTLEGDAPLPHRGGGDAWAAGFALDDGALRWARSWGGLASDAGSALAPGDDGRVRFVGSFASEARMDRVLLTFASGGLAIASLAPSDGRDAWARGAQTSSLPTIEDAMVVDAGLVVLARDASVIDLGDDVTLDTFGRAFSLLRWRDR
ncbi:MAG: hypothetical protein M3Y87_37060, partial [Myxococcota bacterium]|nr:hypothetical protein [Myxococcota bacterium]